MVKDYLILLQSVRHEGERRAMIVGIKTTVPADFRIGSRVAETLIDHHFLIRECVIDSHFFSEIFVRFLKIEEPRRKWLVWELREKANGRILCINF